MATKHKPPLGQHFLRSSHGLVNILREAVIEPSDTILEIGPGKGFLTRALIETAGKVIAVEKDPFLVAYLNDQFKNAIDEKRLIIVNADIRNVDLEKYGIVDGKFKLVANIPYYITGDLLRLFLGGENKPARAVLLVQKEVAERIARSKKESILSLSIKVYGEPHYVKTVPRGLFNPPPQVDSAILTIMNISRKQLKNIDELFFFTLVKQGFSQKRKLLMGNLRHVVEPDMLSKAFTALAIPEKVRAEDMSLKTWLELASLLQMRNKNL